MTARRHCSYLFFVFIFIFSSSRPLRKTYCVREFSLEYTRIPKYISYKLYTYTIQRAVLHDIKTPKAGGGGGGQRRRAAGGGVKNDHWETPERAPGGGGCGGGARGGGGAGRGISTAR